MQIKPHLREIERKTFMPSDVLAILYGKEGFSGLNCRGGVRYLGFPSRVSKIIDKYDWSTGMWQIGDITYDSLRKEVCRFWSDYVDLTPEHIKIGYGSMQILERINKMFLERGTRVLGYSPQFTEYVTEVILSGAYYKGVPLNPEQNFRFDVNKFLSEISSDYCLIYIDNPNNPTGQLIDLIEIEEIIKNARKKDVTVLVDEAYADYAGKEDSAINLIDRYKNLIVTRTFTKGYQFAGIRVGYGVFPSELSDYYDKIDIPFSVPAIGSCLAREALLDKKFIAGLRNRVKRIKEKLLRELREKNYFISNTLETCPIFTLGQKDESCDLKSYLLDKGILTLSGSDYINLGKNYVRVTIPSRAEDFLDRLAA